MKKTVSILIGLSLLLICSQGCRKSNDNSAVFQTKKLLQEITGKGILFGHQDDLAYGIDWNSISGESDVKRITNSYPAVFGWDIGNIGDAENLDGVPFDSIRAYIIKAYEMGGINTVSWHARNPITGSDSWALTGISMKALLPNGSYHSKLIEELDKVATFFESLKTGNEELIPILFRPWHEMNGGWFWWGNTSCSEEEYKALFRFTVDYLQKTKKISNLLIVFSPDHNFESAEQYLARYPGDDYVDILGLDNYSDFEQQRLDRVVVKLGIVSDIAAQKGKIAAFTETGNDRLTIPDWYTSNLLQVLNASEKTRRMAYVMVWRNHDTTHFYVPYPGHREEEDFRNFVNNKMIFLIDDLTKQFYEYQFSK